ncbi:ABC transporter substrate-binding protein [Xylophilus sp. Leaf220]|uniref:ABC transporter substrate-binding protein n=1 Tax=Xylophilus sp. Leaf220 TaxID=1735686 RepID=UPI000ABF5C9F|nr:ABC transporter substrate-binding protein [Xylophilus sp. Leaf220]
MQLSSVSLRLARVGQAAAVSLAFACAGLPAAFAQTAAPDPGASLAAAQAAGTVTVAMVLPRDEQNIEAGFKSYLQRSGLSVRYVPIRATGRAEDAAALRKQVRDAKPQLIYVWGTPTALALAGKAESPPADAIRDIPIVFTEVTDPVGAGLLRTLDKHGGNVTGVSHVAPVPVQLNAIRAYRPFTRLGYLHNPAEPNSALVRERLRELAKAQDFELVNADIPLAANGQPDAEALPGLIRGIAERKADFLYIGPSTFLAFTHRDLVTQAALDARLPTFCATESIVRQARCMFGLFSNGANIGRFAAAKALQILVEHKPVEQVPASTLQRFSLLVNMNTAQQLDLYPPLLLLNVAEVIGVPATAAVTAK